MEENKKSFIAPDVTITICIMMVLISIIIGVSYYFVKDRELMAQNIQTAIEKGIDPLSVRCSYASINDTICVAFAVSHTTTNPAIPMTKK